MIIKYCRKAKQSNVKQIKTATSHNESLTVSVFCATFMTPITSVRARCVCLNIFHLCDFVIRLMFWLQIIFDCSALKKKHRVDIGFLPVNQFFWPFGSTKIGIKYNLLHTLRQTLPLRKSHFFVYVSIFFFVFLLVFSQILSWYNISVHTRTYTQSRELLFEKHTKKILILIDLSYVLFFLSIENKRMKKNEFISK